NAAGIWVSVNGARAGEFDEHGVPVVFTTRTILEEAHTLDEAIAIASRDAPMASHMLLLADGASDESAVVDRAPGPAPAVRRGARPHDGGEGRGGETRARVDTPAPSAASAAAGDGGPNLDERHDAPSVMAAATGNAPVAADATGNAPTAADAGGSAPVAAEAT